MKFRQSHNSNRFRKIKLIRSRYVTMSALFTGASLLTGLTVASQSFAATAFVVNHNTTRGRIEVENDVLRLEFGYKSESGSHGNQGGGNLYYYYDKRYSNTQNIISVWEGGSSQTKAYATGAGGIGSTQIYAVPDVGQTGGASYQFALADNGRDGVVRSTPTVTTRGDGSLKLVFDISVSNKDWSPQYEWYRVLKTWIVYPNGRIYTQHDWSIMKTGWFSEPASRHQVNTVFKKIGRWGHPWGNNVAKPPGSNSRINPANKWYDWTPNPSSVQECNANDGSGGSQDAVHADYNRFYSGPAYDFWFWPYNDGLGFEGLGQYEIGYELFGQSQGSTINEICHHNRTSIGDGSDGYNLGPMGWWGGDGATSDRYKQMLAGTTWSDSFQMEVLPTGQVFPTDVDPDDVDLAEDINQDGKVDFLDFSRLAAKYGQTGASTGRADINKDGVVNHLDLSLLSSRYGQ